MKGLPGPPHSYLFGSLLSMGKVLATQPANAAPQTFIGILREHYDLPEVFYFDPCKTSQTQDISKRSTRLIASQGRWEIQ